MSIDRVIKKQVEQLMCSNVRSGSESSLLIPITGEGILDQVPADSSLSSRQARHAGGSFGKPAEAEGGQKKELEKLTQQVSNLSLGI